MRVLLRQPAEDYLLPEPVAMPSLRRMGYPSPEVPRRGRIFPYCVLILQPPPMTRSADCRKSVIWAVRKYVRSEPGPRRRPPRLTCHPPSSRKRTAVLMIRHLSFSAISTCWPEPLCVIIEFASPAARHIACFAALSSASYRFPADLSTIFRFTAGRPYGTEPCHSEVLGCNRDTKTARIARDSKQFTKIHEIRGVF